MFKKQEYLGIKIATDLLLIILLLALLALPIASLGFSGVREVVGPQVAGVSSNRQSN